MTYNKLRCLRNEMGISAKEMAALLDLKTVAAYYKKENGAVKFSLDEAKLIAEKFNKPIEEIFFNNFVSFMETNHTKKDCTGYSPTGTTG